IEYKTQNIFEPAEEINLNDSITGTVYYTNREGAAFIPEDNIRGFIHESERDIEPRLGETIEGRVIEVKPDGTLNVSLHPLKEDRIESDADIILAYLKINDGKMTSNANSNLEDII